MADTYAGRLACDGLGNLLAEDGRPVAYDDGDFVYVQLGEPSHNERHHQAFVQITGTTGEDGENQPHHFAPTDDDPHKDGVKFLPDRLAESATSHTEAWR